MGIFGWITRLFYKKSSGPGILSHDAEIYQDRVDQLNTIHEISVEKIPISKDCAICGKIDNPPFEGRDGKFYCRDHILPENRGAGERGKPLTESPGSVVHHADGTREFRY